MIEEVVSVDLAVHERLTVRKKQTCTETAYRK